MTISSAASVLAKGFFYKCVERIALAAGRKWSGTAKHFIYESTSELFGIFSVIKKTVNIRATVIKYREQESQIWHFYDTVMNIHEKLNEWVDSQKDSPDPAVLTKPEVKRLFEECGVENEKLETFDQTYEAIAGENASLMAANITNTRRTEIKTPDVVIHIDPDRAALIETQVIDGRKCIVIPMEGDVEINGIHVSSGNSESTES